MQNNELENNTNKVIELMKKPPVLVDSDKLTNSIMDAIDNDQQSSGSAKNRTRVIRFITRTLAVASVLFLMIFGIEQAIVIHKVGKLEQMAEVKSSYSKAVTKNLVILNTGINSTILTKLFSDNNTFINDRKLGNKIRSARITAMAGNRNYRYNIQSLLFQHIK